MGLVELLFLGVLLILLFHVLKFLVEILLTPLKWLIQFGFVAGVVLLLAYVVFSWSSWLWS